MKLNENGIETCNRTPSLPTFISGQLAEDIANSVSIDLDDTEAIADISIYSDQYCTQTLDHTVNENPATILNVPWGETNIYFKRGARSLCYDSGLRLSKGFTIVLYQKKNCYRRSTHLCCN